MPNPWFRFKQFTICQDKCAMKIGTDAILLGAWSNCSTAKTILDIGTGTGVLALMMAQKCNAEIYAIDIEEQAIIQAKENSNNSPWNNRVQFFCTSIQNFKSTIKKFDLIITNPPFFQNSLQAPEKARTHARHNITLTPEDIFESTLKLLSKEGKLAIVWPMEQGEIFIELALTKNLYCQRKLLVKPNPSKKNHRILLEFGFEKTKQISEELTIETDTRHHYTDAYKELTKDFYLHFKY
jgi:tRNA1Val (adenine37-N6)-methyltransferase